MRLQKRKIIVLLVIATIFLIISAMFSISKSNEITVAYAEEILETEEEEETEETEEDTSAQELVVEIEDDLNSQGKSIVGVLGNQKTYYETELSTATPEEEIIIRAKLNTLEKAIEDMSSYMGNSNESTAARGISSANFLFPFNVSPNCTCTWYNYSTLIPCANCQAYTISCMAVTAVIALFAANEWVLAADLLLFNMANTTLDVDYWPTLGTRVAGAPQIANDLAQNNILAGSFNQESPGDYNGISASTIEGDVFNALGEFYYSKKPAGAGMINVSIQDRYDWDPKEGEGIAIILNNAMLTAQERGILTPFYTKISLTMPGYVPFDWEYTDEGVEITGVAEDITEVHIPTTIKDIRIRAENPDDIDITSIADNVFTNNTKIKQLYLSESIVYIDDDAFAGCANLQYVEGLGVGVIGARAFKNCNSLSVVKLSSELAYIYTDAFYGDTSLVIVEFFDTEANPSELRHIYQEAFYGCSHLRQFGPTYNSLILPSKVEEIGAGAFYGTNFENISIGANVTDIGCRAFAEIYRLEDITVASGNTKYTASGGALYDTRGYLLQYALNWSGTSFSVPTLVNGVSIKYIDDEAFMGAQNLVSVHLGNVEQVRSRAFADCAPLESITGLGSLNRIYAGAFDGTAYVEESEDDFVMIGEILYRYKGTDNEILETEFPTGVVRIAPYAFAENESIQTVYLPSNVEYIDEYAFQDCENLSRVYYLGENLPICGTDIFDGHAENFQFRCRRSLIETIDSLTGLLGYYYEGIIAPIATTAYFEDTNETVEFYYGETLEIPDTVVTGWYNQGWRRVDESTNETYGGYLTEIVWWELIDSVRYRADLTRVEDYVFEFYNGDVKIGEFEVALGDSFSLTKTGYTLNGVTHTFANAAEMSNCAYGDYYGPAIVDGVTIAFFDTWWLDGEMVVWGTWEYYHNPRPRFQANWGASMFYALLNNGYGTTQYVEFNYCDGLTLPLPTRDGFDFAGWKTADGSIYEAGEELHPTANMQLTAQWTRTYNIYYQNLTFQGNSARMRGGIDTYQYGVGADLSNVKAVNYYTPRLQFLGWYTDMNFTTKVTSISATQMGDVTLYAKWRYDFTLESRSSSYTITDSDPYATSYDSILIGLEMYDTLKDDLNAIGIEYLVIEFKIAIKEVDNGYQEIMVYDGLSSTSNLLWSVTDIEHTAGTVNTSTEYYIYRLVFEIEDLPDVDRLYIRYGAHGNGGDTWVTEDFRADVMYVVTMTDCYDDVKEFYYTHASPIADEDCIPLEDVSSL